MDANPDILELITALRQEIAQLKEENAELRRRLGLDSANSGKPPSSDGLRKKPRIAGSLRGRSGKPSGGQAGHKGDTLRQVDKPDRVERHTVETCEHCRATLNPAMLIGVERRQVFDLPEPRLEVVEHQAAIYRCGNCSASTRAAFPAGVVAHVQYGRRLRAAAVYLNVQQFVPEDRVCQTMVDRFAATSLCPASVANWVTLAAARLGSVADHVAGRVAQATVRHLDETGFRVGGKTCWLHNASTGLFTHYRVSRKRGDVAQGFQGGVIVHDHFKPYYGLSGVEHALCNAHHLRELKALVDIEHEPWAGAMSDLLLTVNKAVHAARQAGAAALPQAEQAGIVTRYDAILADGLALHEQQVPLARQTGARGRPPRRPGHNLLIRLAQRKADVLRFAADFAVPFTNNQAEQDVRMMKVRMKISGGFRTNNGAKAFASLRSVCSTARKHGLNILNALTTPTDELISALAST